MLPDELDTMKIRNGWAPGTPEGAEVWVLCEALDARRWAHEQARINAETIERQLAMMAAMRAEQAFMNLRYSDMKQRVEKAEGQIDRFRAAVQFLGDEEITPIGRRILISAIEEDLS